MILKGHFLYLNDMHHASFNKKFKNWNSQYKGVRSLDLAISMHEQNLITINC